MNPHGEPKPVVGGSTPQPWSPLAPLGQPLSQDSSDSAQHLEYNNFAIPNELLGLSNTHRWLPTSQEERRLDVTSLWLEVHKSTQEGNHLHLHQNQARV